MALAFLCPQCEAKIVVAYLKPGDEARCRTCGHMTPVPDNAIHSEDKPSIEILTPSPVRPVEPPAPQPDWIGEDPNPSTWPGVLFSVDGRISRSTYWLRGIIPLYAWFMAAIMLDIFTGLANDETGLGAFYWLALVLSIYPSIALTIKRLHDRDRSGFFILIGLIPVLGGIWLSVETYFLRGTTGANKFGPDPVEARQRMRGQKLVYVVSGIVAFIFLSLVGLGVLLDQHVLPDNVVLRGGELRDHEVKSLKTMGLLDDDESIEFFYSNGVFSIEEEGNFFTADRVVSYEVLSGNLFGASATWVEIRDMVVEISAEMPEMALIRVYLADGDQFSLVVCTQDDQHEMFYNRMLQLWEEKKAMREAM